MRFEIGEVVIVLDSDGAREGIINAGPCELAFRNISNEMQESKAIGYYVEGHSCEYCKDSCGVHFYPPEMLRKKRLPPTQDFTAGEWELCPWRPETAKIESRIKNP